MSKSTGIMVCIGLTLAFLIIPFCIAYFIVETYMKEFPSSFLQLFIFYCLAFGIQISMRNNKAFDSLESQLKKALSSKS